jgi:hypothetical protein
MTTETSPDTTDFPSPERDPQPSRATTIALFIAVTVLPRLIPASYAILESGYRLFGREEFGSRTMPAIFGTLHVAMVFLFGTRLHGRRFGLILSLLVALWPEHIFHSQQNRFYMFAMCGSTLAFFLATLGLQKASKNISLVLLSSLCSQSRLTRSRPGWRRCSTSQSSYAEPKYHGVSWSMGSVSWQSSVPTSSFTPYPIFEETGPAATTDGCTRQRTL